MGACLLVALTVIGVWHVTRLPYFTISTVEVDGGETITHEMVRTKVEEVLAQSYISLIPYRFTFLYPHDAIRDTLYSLSRIKNVSVDRNGASLSVAYDEYVPYALWCLSANDTECFFIDETGFAFAPGPRLEGGTFVRHMIEGVSELSRTEVFETQEFATLHALLARLHAELALRVTDVTHTKDDDLVLRVHGGGELKLRKDTEYDRAFDNLVSVLTSPEFRHLEPGNFQYIDLRFGNKVFVNETLVDDTLSTSTPTSTQSANEI
jgi:cell division septal protein FtsQ